MCKFNYWSVTARVVAAVNLCLILGFLVTSVVTVINSSPEKKNYVKYGLLYAVRFIGIVTTIFLFKCNTPNVSTKWALRGTKIWLFVNFALFHFLLALFAWKIEPVLTLAEMIVRGLSILIVLFVIRDQTIKHNGQLPRVYVF